MCKPTELDDEQLIEHIAEFLDELNDRMEKRQVLVGKLKDKLDEIRIYVPGEME